MSDVMIGAIYEDLCAVSHTKSVPEQSLDEITRLVTEGMLKPGDRLPSESELAKDST